jgi:predicted ATPase/class 3 adenylate cyclase/Tfp pilus assembly protein PilF
MVDLPTGTVTFLFTDVEGSTRLWEQQPAAMKVATARHDAIVEMTVEHYGGALVRPRGEGDSRFAVFARASDAVAAAAALQAALTAEAWSTPAPLRVRLALHTGEADLREGDYYGTAVNRCARLRAIAHGGQILLSQSTYDLVRDVLPAGLSIRDVGEHRLADLVRPEQVFQLSRADLPTDFPPLRSLDSYPHNLPMQLTSFIGREKELVDLGRALTTRLLTLTGTGGAGKTRLALQLAADQLDRFPEGVWVVELASLTDPALVTQAVALVVGVREEPGQPLLTTLLAALRGRQLLLLLDNCEHLLEACAQLTDAVLRGCPWVQILATSREALGIAGEVARRVPSLAVPPADRLPPIEQLNQYAAVRLFVERALAVQPAFVVTNQNAPAVAQLCWRLDGIPLALELAAARVRVLTVEQIAARLDDRFRVLTGGSRTALPRQQTLRAAIDWSYQLLSDAERALLRRLAVFVGDWSLEAAEAVCEGVGSVLDLLTALVDKSLVIAESKDEEGRYRLLETIRQYAGEKLRESGEADATRALHRGWYRALVERAEPELSGPQQRNWLDRLERERDNLRTVLEGSVADPLGLEEGLRMAAALWRLWIVRGYLGEGRHLLSALLAPAATIPAVRQTAARMGALYAASLVAYLQGDYAATGSLAEECLAVAQSRGDERWMAFATDQLVGAIMNQGDYPRATALSVDVLATMRRVGDRVGMSYALMELAILARLQGDYERSVARGMECLALCREAGDLWAIGQLLSNLGLTYYQQGQYQTARHQFAEALALRRELRDQSGTAWSLINLGNVEQAEGAVAAARTRFDESLRILRDLGDRSGSADALASLGRVAQAQGDYTAARQCYVESLAIRRELGHRLAMPAAFEGLAGLVAAQEQYARALTLAGAAAAMRDALGAPPSPVEREQLEDWLGRARGAVGDQGAAEAWARGQAMTLEQALDYALSDNPLTMSPAPNAG